MSNESIRPTSQDGVSASTDPDLLEDDTTAGVSGGGAMAGRTGHGFL